MCAPTHLFAHAARRAVEHAHQRRVVVGAQHQPGAGMRVRRGGDCSGGGVGGEGDGEGLEGPWVGRVGALSGVGKHDEVIGRAACNCPEDRAGQVGA